MNRVFRRYTYHAHQKVRRKVYPNTFHLLPLGGNLLRVVIRTVDRKAPTVNDVILKNEAESAGHVAVYIDDIAPGLVETYNFDVIVQGDVNFGNWGQRDVNFKGGVLLRGASVGAFKLASSATSAASKTQLVVSSPLHNHPTNNGVLTVGTHTVKSAAAAFATITPANKAPGTKFLAVAQGTSDACLAIAEKGHVDSSGEPFIGRRGLIGHLNNAQNGTTLGYDSYRSMLLWAGNKNVRPSPTIVTVGIGGTHASMTAAIAAISGIDYSTVVAGGRRDKFVWVSDLNEKINWVDATIYTDGDCYTEIDGNYRLNNFTGSLASDEDLHAWSLSFTHAYNFRATHSGTRTGSGGSASGNKLIGNFVKCERFIIYNIMQSAAANISGVSVNGGLGREAVNFMVHTIDCSVSGEEVRGARMLGGGSIYWPNKCLGFSISNIGNNSVSPTVVDGFEIFSDGANGDTQTTKSGAITNVNGSCFHFIVQNGGLVRTAYLASDDATADDNGDGVGTHLINQTASQMFKSPTVPVDLDIVVGGVLDGASVDLIDESSLMTYDIDGDLRKFPYALGADQPSVGHIFHNRLNMNVWLRR